jgi:hypothetical protein
LRTTRLRRLRIRRLVGIGEGSCGFGRHCEASLVFTGFGYGREMLVMLWTDLRNTPPSVLAGEFFRLAALLVANFGVVVRCS